MPKEFGRKDRVASQMQKELSFILQRELRDPRLGFITINDVELTRDLALAKVYFTVLSPDAKARAAQQKLLADLTPQIRHLLAGRMRLRHIAELRFIYDDSFDKGMRVAALLGEVGRNDE